MKVIVLVAMILFGESPTVIVFEFESMFACHESAIDFARNYPVMAVACVETGERRV